MSEDLISRQQAIDALEREQSLVERPITEIRWFDLGLKKAQDVLRELPSATQSNTSNTLSALDVIERQAAIDALGEEPLVWRDNDMEIAHRQQWLWDKEAIEAVPAAQPERKKGRWILWNYPGCECARCSVCKTEYDQDALYIGGNEYPNFCPDCGADMREEEP